MSPGEPGHCCGTQELPFSLAAVSEPRRVSNQGSWFPGTISVHLSWFGVCCGSLGESLPVCSRARRSSFSFSWILACLLPQREKKKKKKGHVCLEKYVGQWNISCTGAKEEEGRRGGEGEADQSSEGALLASAPQPTCFCLVVYVGWRGVK